MEGQIQRFEIEKLRVIIIILIWVNSAERYPLTIVSCYFMANMPFDIFDYSVLWLKRGKINLNLFKKLRFILLVK